MPLLEIWLVLLATVHLLRRDRGCLSNSLLSARLALHLYLSELTAFAKACRGQTLQGDGAALHSLHRNLPATLVNLDRLLLATIVRLECNADNFLHSCGVLISFLLLQLASLLPKHLGGQLL